MNRRISRISRRWADAFRRASRFQMEELEQRVLLSASASPALNNPIVPLPPLPTGTEPLQGVVGTPFSLDPQLFDTAYNFNSIFYNPPASPTSVVVGNGAGQTIAIVDPYGSPTIANDLQVFDAHWGISNDDAEGNFCLTIQALAPTVNTIVGDAADIAGWGQETSLDVEWAHAVAPGAHILLVEAPSERILDLMDADVYAAAQPGVVTVSMSWFISVANIESFQTENEPSLYDGFMVTPTGHLDSDGLPGDVAFFAASGDADPTGTPPTTAAQLNYPAASDNVISVGGQSIGVDINGNIDTYGSWDDSQGGTDTIYTPPDYYEPLVSLDADPNSGVWVYNSGSGWEVVGGTSLATPAMAAYVAIIDQGLAINGLPSIGTGALWDDILFDNEFSLPLATSTFKTFEVLPPASSYPLYPDLTHPTGTPEPANPDDLLTPNNGNTGWGSPIGPNFAATVIDYDESYESFWGDVTNPTGPVTPYQAVSSGFNGNTGLPLDIMAFTQLPTSGQVGQPISGVVDVYLTDEDTLDTTFNGPVTISVEYGPQGSSVTGTATVDAVNGVATFSDIVLNTTGNYYLQASTQATANSPGAIPGESALITMTYGSAVGLGFTQEPAAAWQYSTTQTVVVAALDSLGNVVQNDNSTSITLSINSGPAGGVLGTTLTRTVVNGQATFSNLSLNLPGTYTLEATDGVLGTAVSTSFTVVAIPVRQTALLNGLGLSSSSLLLEERRDGSTIVSTPVPAVIQQVQAQASPALSPVLTSADSTTSALSSSSASDAADSTQSQAAAPGVSLDSGNLSTENSDNAGADENLLDGN
jgi:subtilase family serine protease